MEKLLRAVPAFFACVLLCFSTGCSGVGSLSRVSDGSGGYVVYETREGVRREVAIIDSAGEIRPPAMSGVD